MDLVTLAIFVIVLIAALYLVRFIPDPTIQTVAKIIVVVGAVLWLVTHLRELLHLHA